MKSPKFYFLVIQLFGLLCVSIFTQYQFPDYQRMNLQIANMMTPTGLIHNLWIDSMSALKVYYFLEPTGNIDFSSQKFFLLIIILGSLLLTFFMYLKYEYSQTHHSKTSRHEI